ncbi:hypothetical protein [Microcoleus anatoxicus]|uniref:hypothetical protein n=1 Tax=Microcoleus anatoxicus TaxID=2705319 RepID=UPI0030C92420
MDWRHLPDHKVVRLQRDDSCKLPAIALSSVSAIASLTLEIMNTKFDFEVLEKITFRDLKKIASDLGIFPTRGDGDARKKRTWELAIATQSQALGLSIEEVCNPILRTLKLGGRNKIDWATIEQTLELIEPYLYPSICAYKTSPELLRNSPAANLAAKVLPGVAYFQNLSTSSDRCCYQQDLDYK